MTLDFKLTPKQRLFIETDAFEVLYGGAAGGGKTFVQALDALLYALQYGAIAPHSSANLNDDPLYLSPRGVYAPTTTYYNNMQVRQLFCRSRRINPKLTKEKRLSEAVSAVWRGWYVLVLPNGNAYVADGNQDRSDNGYEWYFWNNIPAHSMRSHEQTLYFGTLDGRLCKFNDDRVNTDNQVLMNAYSDDGAAIRAEWATKLDTMDSISELKRLNKRGTSVHLKSYARSGIQVWIRTEKDPGKMHRVLYADTFNFEDIAFYRLTFDGTRNAMRPLNTKIDDWKAIQFWLVSEGVNEGFGLYEVEASYMVIKEAKQ